MNLTGTIFGYDPGGDSKHGVAFFSYKQESTSTLSISPSRTNALTAASSAALLLIFEHLDNSQ